MKTDDKKKMIMSATPAGVALITLNDSDAIKRLGKLSDESMCETYRACSDAIATEVVPMTEEAYSGFAERHNCRPVHPTLAAYPYPRG